MNTLLEQIHNGMKVYDQAHDEVGTVDYVQFGDEDPLKPGGETVTTQSAPLAPEDTLLNGIAKVFGPDEIPEVFRDRLLRFGFIRVDARGLFNADRYILSDQIGSISEDNVMLNVTKSELIKRP